MVLNEQQVQTIIKNFIEVYKTRMNYKDGIGTHKPKEYWNGYQYSVDQYEAIEPHAVGAVYPEKNIQRTCA